jgi:hypothetical protein
VQLVESVDIPGQKWQLLGFLRCPCLLTRHLLPPWLAIRHLRALWVLCCLPSLLSPAYVSRLGVILSSPVISVRLVHLGVVHVWCLHVPLGSVILALFARCVDNFVFALSIIKVHGLRMHSCSLTIDITKGYTFVEGEGRRPRSAPSAFLRVCCTILLNMLVGEGRRPRSAPISTVQSQGTILPNVLVGEGRRSRSAPIQLHLLSEEGRRPRSITTHLSFSTIPLTVLVGEGGSTRSAPDLLLSTTTIQCRGGSTRLQLTTAFRHHLTLNRVRFSSRVHPTPIRVLMQPLWEPGGLQVFLRWTFF